MLDSGLLFNNRPQEKSKHRNVLLTVQVEVHKPTSRGYMGRVKAWCRQSDKTWSTCLQQTPQVECCGFPKLGTDQSIQAKKSKFLINSMGFTCKGKVSQAGDTVDHTGRWGSHIRDLHLLVILQAVIWSSDFQPFSSDDTHKLITKILQLTPKNTFLLIK